MNSLLCAKRLCIAVVLAVATVLEFSAVARAADPPPKSDRIVRWLNGDTVPRLDAFQADAYAQQQQRRPEALLAACQASSQIKFLREAMTKYPRDPRVAMAAVSNAGSLPSNPGGVDARQFLDTFKRIAPNNALAYYLSARDYFKRGESDLAEKEVLAGSNKLFRDYAVEFIENTEDAYHAAGYSEAEATALAMSTLVMPHFAQLRALGKDLVKRSQHHRRSGDAAAAEGMLRAAIRIGAQLDQTNSLTILQNLVGIMIQQHALQEMEPAASFGENGRTAQVDLDRLFDRHAQLRTLTGSFNARLEQMSDKEIVSFFNEQKRIGEEAASRRALAQ